MSEDGIIRVFLAMIPIIMAAMGYQFQVIRAIQKQLDACIEVMKREE